jgi:hypothetical protein
MHGEFVEIRICRLSFNKQYALFPSFLLKYLARKKMRHYFLDIPRANVKLKSSDKAQVNIHFILNA